MKKYNSQYYLILKAVNLFGCELDDLLHLGVIGKLPIYIMPNNWWGTIYDFTPSKPGVSRLRIRTREEQTPKRILLYNLRDGRLLEDTVKLFEIGEEEVTVESIWLSPNPESGKPRQANLDVPVVIKKSQLIVFTKDMQNLSLAAPNQADEAPDNITSESMAQTETTDNLKVGLNKHQIALAFDGIYWAYEKWESNLDPRRKWLRKYYDSIISLGKQGNREGTLWNPVAIAINLQEKYKNKDDAKKNNYDAMLDNAFRKKPTLQPWSQEWDAYKYGFPNS